MKQYFSILAALILCSSATTLKAQNVNIPDANFKNYLLSSPVNTNLDFEIQVSEAQSFTGHINLITLNITDLTGLEEFAQLQRFTSQYIPVTSLDLSTNTMLTDIVCVGSPITSLDLSNNINLTRLICQRTDITELDLSSNVNLTEVDLREDTLLTTIYIRNGNNTAILTPNFLANGNPALQCVEVDSVAYSVANWTSVDTGVVFSTTCFTNTTTIERTLHAKVYPNPTPNKLTIDLGAIYSDAKITISNAIGQKVQTANYNNIQILDLEITGLSGWYFIHIETEKGQETIKVLKQ